MFQTTGDGVPTKAELNLNGLGGDLAEGGIIYPMNRYYHQALVAVGVNSTYDPHAGGHDLPNCTGELTAFRARGLFKPVPTHPRSWTNLTVATAGQLWNVGYRFASPPTQVVTFTHSGQMLTVTAAGSDVTLTFGRGCTTETPTPATVTLPRHCW